MIRIYKIIFILFFCLKGISLCFAVEDVSDKEYILGPEDVLEIQVWGEENLHRTVEISKEGDFTFPFIGKVHASDLSVFELENLITQKLSGRFLTNPQVSVSVVKYRSQKVFLLGEVKKPGSYILKGKTHLLEIISKAGGLTRRSGRTVTIVRPGSNRDKMAPVPLEDAKENKIITLDIDHITPGDTDERLFVVDGDSIYVSKAHRIFVTGEVKNPGVFTWEKGLTVRQAISLAGGPTGRGAPNRTKIIRTEKGKEKEFKPEMSDTLMPDDIIKVPESYF